MPTVRVFGALESEDRISRRQPKSLCSPRMKHSTKVYFYAFGNYLHAKRRRSASLEEIGWRVVSFWFERIDVEIEIEVHADRRRRRYIAVHIVRGYYISTSRIPSLSTTLTLYLPGSTTRRFDTSLMQRFRVARPSSRDASGSW
jgi:hypothetical protein